MPTANELNVNTTATAQDMADAIFGDGVTVTNATYTGAATASGTYTGGTATLGELTQSDTGVILSTGNVADFTNSSGTSDTNTNDGTSTDHSGAGEVDGDADLNAVSGQATQDGAFFEADFIAENDLLTMQFVFTSEEYLEYVNGGVNDAFGVWVNDEYVPLTLADGSTQNVSIDTINDTSTSNLYLDNPTAADTYNTEMDGGTVVLSLTAPVNPGESNNIRIGIGDGGDSAYDSNVLIMGDSIQTVSIAESDQLAQGLNTTQVHDLLSNDINYDGNALTITHINNVAVSVGETVTLPSGEQITLNADMTVDVLTDSDIGTNDFTYSTIDSAGNTATGYATIETTTTPPDFIVEGTAGNDVIDTAYTGDPEGDMIDANDHSDASNDDSVVAGAGNDSVVAGDGNDTVFGQDGADTILGGAGDDEIDGDDAAATGGADSIDGGAGNDQIIGDVGNDTLIGDFGDDTIFGGADDDFIDAGSNNDLAFGEAGDDTLDGGVGSDTLYGREGDDLVQGGGNTSNADELYGGAGNDTVVGGDGASADSLFGDDGDDELRGQEGADTIAGGSGDDTIILQDDFGNDSIIGGELGETGGDTLDLSGLTQDTTVDLTSADPEAGSVSNGSDSATFSEIENITLGGGTDTVTLADGSGSDTVQAFEAPIDNGDGTFTGQDQLDVSGLTSDGGTTPVTTVDVTVTDDGSGNAVLSFPGGESITLIGVDPTSVNSIDELVAIGIPDGRDYIVEGTAGNDYIGVGYLDDPQGDLVDSTDNAAGNNDDSILAGDGNDTIIAALGNDTVDAGAGDDSARGGDGDDTLLGNTGNDILLGEGGNDSVSGGAGTDSMLGGLGEDTLEGGDDADTILGEGGNDSIDGDLGDDSLSGGDNSDTVAGGGGADEVFGNAGDDLLYGGTGNDSVFGGIGDDTMLGDAGDDVMEGWLGNDSMVGGAGDDYLDGASGDDTLLGQDGDDTLLSGSDGGADLVIGGTGDDSLSTGDGNDTLEGGLDDDSMFGGGGDDLFTLEDNFGNDTIEGWSTSETSGDTLDATAVTGDVTVDLTAFGSAADPESGTISDGTSTATFADIENIALGAGNDSIAGSDGDDTIAISTGAGADTIDGGAGNDAFDIGAGDGADDTIVLADGDGDDTITGFETPTDNGDGTFTGSDQLDLTGLTDAGGALVNTDDVTVTDTNGDGTGDAILQFPNGESITLVGVLASEVSDPAALEAMGIPAPDYIVEGTASGDVIDSAYTGDPEGDRVDAGDNLADNNDDSILAGAGNDTISAGLGNDSIDAGTGDDQVFGEGGNDTVLAGDGADTVFGEVGDDSLTGGLGNDSILGGTGNDALLGEVGDDTLRGEDGNDTIIGGDGNDSAHGGNGDDSMSGGAGNDELHGWYGNDTIDGGEGNDYIDADIGADLATGGDGNDTIMGGFSVESDTLQGEAGDDSIDGQAGNDLIEGGIGDDTLLGSDGDDTFTLTDSFGNDTITGGETDETSGDSLDASAVTADTTLDLTAGIASDPESGTLTASQPVAPAGYHYVRVFEPNDPAAIASLGVYPNGDIDFTDGTFHNVLVQDDDSLLHDSQGISGGGGNEDPTQVFAEDLNGLPTTGNGIGVPGVSQYTDANGDSFSVGWIASLYDGEDTGVPDNNYLIVTDAAGGEPVGTGTATGTTNAIANIGYSSFTGTPDADTTSFSEIENITLGAGNDSVIGSAGDDTVSTGAGADTVDGGAGNDTFDVGAADGANDTVVLDDGDGDDTISGFEGPIDNGDGTFTGQDQIDTSGLTDADGNPVLVSDVTVSDDGSGNAVLNFPNGESITLIGVAPSEVTEHDALAAMGIAQSDYIVEGTAGNDVIDGSYAGDPDGDFVDNLDSQTNGNDDRIVAGAGNDTILAGDGNDSIEADEGDDSVSGGDGDDDIFGFEGNDTVDGGAGDDFINTRTSPGTGLPDEEYNDGGFLDYTADADPNNDRDSVIGGDGNDTILSGDDNDTLIGGLGADSVDAGFDDDTVTGDAGNDTLEGNEGDDTIEGGTGDDLIYGELSPSNPDYASYSFYELENDGTDAAPNNNEDSLLGGDGNDSIYGQDDNDTLSGGSGDDLLDGGIDDDSLDGGTGADILIGGTGNDTITAAQGDTITGGDGDDYFTIADIGEAGNDSISITGGEGAETNGDTLYLGPDYSQTDLNFTNTDDTAGGISGNFTMTDGTVVNFSEIENIICFTPGTRILTAHGERRIEELREGDMVVTRDHGLRPIRWIGKRSVPGSGRFAPVQLGVNALAGAREGLLISPQHRILFTGYRAELLFGEAEVLVPAKHLIDGREVVQREVDEVTYIHLMFDRHEVIYAEGIATESFHAGDVGLDAVDESAREELFAIFPELRSAPYRHGKTARTCLKAHEAITLKGQIF